MSDASASIADTYREDGFVFPVDVLSTDEAREVLQDLEAPRGGGRQQDLLAVQRLEVLDNHGTTVAPLKLGVHSAAPGREALGCTLRERLVQLQAGLPPCWLLCSWEPKTAQDRNRRRC